MRFAIFVALLALASGCKPGGRAPAAGKFSLRQFDARYYYDLGADTVDVADYPAVERDNYEIFTTVCSQCHTLARAINAPLTSREEWDRYVTRMHKRTLVHEWWTRFAKEDAKRILDFLEYDSRVRKIDDGKVFARETESLKVLFQEVQREKSRLQMSRDRENVKPYPHFAGDKP